MTCTKCRLGEQSGLITNRMSGHGCEYPDVLFIGEGPGEQEDKQGKPFVGKSGQLLRQSIRRVAASLGLSAFLDEEETKVIGKFVVPDTRTILCRFTNTVRCRPPGNRDPKDDEIQACKNYLVHEILDQDPKIIVCLGRVAANGLLRGGLKAGPKPLVRLAMDQSKLFWWQAPSEGFYPVRVVYHPAAVGRNQRLKPYFYGSLREVFEYVIQEKEREEGIR